MTTTRPIDVVIVEDEPHLAELHREYIEQNFHLRIVGIAASLEQARMLIAQYQPRLILLDNYLPDGKGVELIDSPLLKSIECAVIFITAASDMQTCSHAMRSGAFDYLIKPVFFQRLHASLERFMRFIHTVRQVKVVDQHALDRLFNLPTAESSPSPSTKGIEPNTLERIKRFFADNPERNLSVEEVVDNVGISKTTGRRYLEYCVESGLISIEMLYGNIGHPRRLYRKVPNAE
ncbi:response regulator [Enterobacter sp. RHBSTW-00994]|uniref:response regulator n=1 Tax=Enterobacteriaceae TaxID=543 RepID=UPI0015EA273A|nr:MULTISPECIES: response regulator [Enterobacteriaceae]MBM3072288.1 response regulator [Lelliottia sp. RWM.1]QLR44488.1 response regulator [Enterobacter sp. RHBSTW-00994]